MESHTDRHPGEQMGTQSPKAIGGWGGKREEKCDTQMGMGERERRLPVTELVSGGRQPSWGQAVAQVAFVCPSLVCTLHLGVREPGAHQGIQGSPLPIPGSVPQAPTGQKCGQCLL